MVLVLDSQHRVIGRPVLAHIGTMDNVEAHPRDIFREAIRRNAKGLIVGHNHPSGELAPSTQDKDLAVRIDNGGKLLGIQVLDHIVVGRRGHRSMSAGEWS